MVGDWSVKWCMLVDISLCERSTVDMLYTRVKGCRAVHRVECKSVARCSLGGV